MRWGWFALALLLVYVLATAWPHTWLDLLAAFALACALLLPAEDAWLAGWITGFSHDLAGHGPIGIHALALGLAAYGLTRIRDGLNRELWWVRWLGGFVVLFPAQILVALHQRYIGGQRIPWWQIVTEPAGVALLAALLAALAAGVPAAIARRRRHLATRW
ncbi:MAG: hypothetical protein AB1716_08195 [Planctomycetota bacterium]